MYLSIELFLFHLIIIQSSFNHHIIILIIIVFSFQLKQELQECETLLAAELAAEEHEIMYLSKNEDIATSIAQCETLSQEIRDLSHEQEKTNRDLLKLKVKSDYIWHDMVIYEMILFHNY